MHHLSACRKAAGLFAFKAAPCKAYCLQGLASPPDIRIKATAVPMRSGFGGSGMPTSMKIQKMPCLDQAAHVPARNRHTCNVTGTIPCFRTSALCHGPAHSAGSKQLRCYAAGPCLFCWSYLTISAPA